MYIYIWGYERGTQAVIDEVLRPNMLPGCLVTRYQGVMAPVTWVSYHPLPGCPITRYLGVLSPVTWCPVTVLTGCPVTLLLGVLSPFFWVSCHPCLVGCPVTPADPPAIRTATWGVPLTLDLHVTCSPMLANVTLIDGQSHPQFTPKSRCCKMGVG